MIEGHPGIDDLDDARRHLDRLVEVGALGAKLTIEDGYFLPVLPVHAQALREQIVAEARARGLPVFVHAQHRDAHAQALALRPHAVSATWTTPSPTSSCPRRSAARPPRAVAGAATSGAWPA